MATLFGRLSILLKLYPTRDGRLPKGRSFRRRRSAQLWRRSTLEIVQRLSGRGVRGFFGSFTQKRWACLRGLFAWINRLSAGNWRKDWECLSRKASFAFSLRLASIRLMLTTKLCNFKRASVGGTDSKAKVNQSKEKNKKVNLLSLLNVYFSNARLSLSYRRFKQKFLPVRNPLRNLSISTPVPATRKDPRLIRHIRNPISQIRFSIKDFGFASIGVSLLKGARASIHFGFRHGRLDPIGLT